MLMLREVFDAIIMVAVVGYLFRDVFSHVDQRRALQIAILITAPAILLHEFAHKFVALALGIVATFHAAYFFLLLGILFKLLNMFIFFVPGYVSHAGAAPFASVLIAFSGPALNLLLWQGAKLLIKKKQLSPHQHGIAFATAELNKWLFLFNMLPIPPFDGFQVVAGLYRIFF